MLPFDAMRYRELDGWDRAIRAACETWPRISEDVWRRVGVLEAPEGKTFVSSQNELFVLACGNDWVRFPGR